MRGLGAAAAYLAISEVELSFWHPKELSRRAMLTAPFRTQAVFVKFVQINTYRVDFADN